MFRHHAILFLLACTIIHSCQSLNAPYLTYRDDKLDRTLAEIAEIAYGNTKLWPLLAGFNGQDFSDAESSIIPAGAALAVPPAEICTSYMPISCLQAEQHMRNDLSFDDEQSILKQLNLVQEGRLLSSSTPVSSALLWSARAFVQKGYDLSQSVQNYFNFLDTSLPNRLYNFGFSLEIINDSPETITNFSTALIKGEARNFVWKIDPSNTASLLLSDSLAALDTTHESSSYTESNNANLINIAGFITFSLQGPATPSYILGLKHGRSAFGVQPHLELAIREWKAADAAKLAGSQVSNFLTDFLAENKATFKNQTGWFTIQIPNTNHAFDLFLSNVGNTPSTTLRFYTYNNVTFSQSYYYSLEIPSKQTLMVMNGSVARNGLGVFKNNSFTLRLEQNADDKAPNYPQAHWVILEHRPSGGDVTSNTYQALGQNKFYLIMNRFYGSYLRASSDDQLDLANPVNLKNLDLSQYLWQITKNNDGTYFINSKLYRDSFIISTSGPPPSWDLAPFASMSSPNTAKIQLTQRDAFDENIVSAGIYYRIQRYQYPLVAININPLRKGKNTQPRQIAQNPQVFKSGIFPNPKYSRSEIFTLTKTTCNGALAITVYEAESQFFLGAQDAARAKFYTNSNSNETIWVLEKANDISHNVYHFKNCRYQTYLTSYSDPINGGMPYTLEATPSDLSIHHFSKYSFYESTPF